MSKHNRERRMLWKLGLHKKQLGFKLKGRKLDEALTAAKQRLVRQMRSQGVFT